MWSCWDGISWGKCLAITCPLSLVRDNHFTQTTLFPQKGFWHWLAALRRSMCALKHRFSWFDVLIWTFMLWSYFGKSLFFEKCVQDCNNPKPTKMGEAFVDHIGMSDKVKFGFQCFKWMAFPISKSFREDPLRGWRSSLCKEALGDWFHAWHTSWDEDFLICGEDSCEAQVTNFIFMSIVKMTCQGNVPH